MSLLAYVVSHDVLKKIIDSILFVHFPSFLLMFFRYFRAPVESCVPPPEVDLEMQRQEPLQQQLKNIFHVIKRKTVLLCFLKGLGSK